MVTYPLGWRDARPGPGETKAAGEVAPAALIATATAQAPPPTEPDAEAETSTWTSTWTWMSAIMPNAADS
jgi:hypothetical protein